MDAKDYEKMRRQILERRKKNEEVRLAAEKEKMMQEGQMPLIEEQKPQVYVHPDAMAPDAATLLYAICMGVAALFNGRIIIWIVLTVIWLRHLAKFKK